MWCAVGLDRVEVKTGDFDVFQAFLTVLNGLNRSVRTALIDRLAMIAYPKSGVFVLPDPCEKVFISHFARRDGKTDTYDVFVGRIDMDSVGLQKGQKHIHTNALVPVDERMVGDQRESDL